MADTDGYEIKDSTLLARFHGQAVDPPTPDDPALMDDLTEYFRVERWSGMANKPIDQPLTDAERKQVTDNIKGYIEASKITRAALAKSCGLSPSVVIESLSGRYSGRVDDVLRKIAAVIEADCQRREAPSPGIGFVETRVAKEVAAIVKLASSLKKMAAFWEESGVGKSMALRAVMAKDFPNGILIEINEGSSSPLNFLNSLCRAAARRGPSDFRKRADAFNAIVELLSGSNRMIAIDEADGLQKPCFNITRQLHDATGCPVVLAGRPPLQAKLAATLRDPSTGGSVAGRIIVQYSLSSRIVGHSHRPGGAWLFSEAEVVEMLRKYRVRIAPSAIRFLAALANTSSLGGSRTEQGALRYMIGIFEMAVLLAKGREITKQLCHQALILCRGSDAGEIVSMEADKYAEARTA